MTMFERVYEMNDDIQHDCNDSFATMFIEESACALWNNQQRLTRPIRSLSWIPNNSAEACCG